MELALIAAGQFLAALDHEEGLFKLESQKGQVRH